MGVMSIMGPQGDHKIRWDPDTGEGVREAEQAFNDARDNHMAMFSRDETGQFEQLKKFDPQAKEIIGAPPLVGG